MITYSGKAEVPTGPVNFPRLLLIAGQHGVTVGRWNPTAERMDIYPPRFSGARDGAEHPRRVRDLLIAEETR